MDANEAHRLSDERQNRHEAKCDECQKVLFDKISRLEKHVYMAIGVLVVLELIMIVVGPTIAQKVMGG